MHTHTLKKSEKIVFEKKRSTRATYKPTQPDILADQVQVDLFLLDLKYLYLYPFFFFGFGLIIGSKSNFAKSSAKCHLSNGKR